jgi:PAS domain-containing protein
VKLSFFYKICLLTIAGLVTVFYIDPLDNSTVSSPFLLGLILTGLSLRQNWSLVAVTSLIYLVLALYSLIRFHSYFAAHIYANPHPYFWLFQRTGLFLVLCVLAIYLASYRMEAEKILGRFQSMLGKLPTPVIISDASGVVTYVNDAVSPILSQLPSEIIGRSYFDFILTDPMKGQSIRNYFDLFDADTHRMRELSVYPFSPGDKWNAQIACLGSGAHRIMITVLQSPKNMTASIESVSHDPAQKL